MTRLPAGRVGPGALTAAGRVLVAGVGNIFRGDDGFGPAVVEWLHRDAVGPWPDGVVVRDYGIRGVHLAYDLLDGYDDVVFVDTMHRGGEPGTVYVVEPALDACRAGAVQGSMVAPSLDAHDLAPEAVLALVPDLGGSLGRVTVVGCEPVSLADGIGLSPAVSEQVPSAGRIVRGLVAHAVGTRGSVPRAASADHRVGVRHGPVGGQ
ncbi:MAG: hydrogenase maturation protease [Kineosporiaceae bacterium]|jgi:hydrogenase maturation protease